MNGFEFIVELSKTYGLLLSALGWPLVILVIFFSLFYYFDRTLGVNRRKKRMPFSWKQMNALIQQMDQQRSLSETNSKRESLVKQQLDRAHQAIERHDENEVVQSLAALSLLAIHTDKQIKTDQLPDGIKQVNMILPDLKPKPAEEDSSDE